MKSSSLADIDKMQRKQLKSYISDLEQSVKINKELLQNVLMAADLKEGAKQAIDKLQGEVDRLSTSLQTSLKEKLELVEVTKQAQKDKDEIKELMLDKEQKFETYLQKCRQDLDERNRTIDHQTKALERLKPIVERFEREMNAKEGNPPPKESETSRQSKRSETGSEASVMTVEYNELINENEELSKALGQANQEIQRLRAQI